MILVGGGRGVWEGGGGRLGGGRGTEARGQQGGLRGGVGRGGLQGGEGRHWKGHVWLTRPGREWHNQADAGPERESAWLQALGGRLA